MMIMSLIRRKINAWGSDQSEHFTASQDLDALNRTKAEALQRSHRFRDLCQLSTAKAEFKKALKFEVGQREAAHRLGPLLDPVDRQRNRCHNFHAFVSALRWAADRVA